ILRKWTRRSRWNEIDDSLIKSLCFLDEGPALEVLDQLKEPRHVISKIGNHNTMLVSSKVWSPSNRKKILSPTTMLDCGAFNAYIHEDYVKRHDLQTTPLSHPIPVYNADGSMNRSGSIK
ncbi:hypothetical protein BDN70DRAFT_764180, partial [Pholiota conissans]